MIENLNGTHETVNYRENTNLRIYDNVEYEEYPLHWHSPIEILMPVRSEYVFEYNDALCTLREGDIAIICPAVLHHLFPSEGERYIIQAEMTSVLNLREISSILSMIYPAAVITPEQYPDSIYDKMLGEIKKGNLETGKVPTLTCIIKCTDEASYKNMVDALDEMTICSIGTYVIDKINEDDEKLLGKLNIK